MPAAAFLMTRDAFAQHFRADQIDRLGACCDLVSREPFASVADLSATGANPDIVVTGWGSPVLPGDTLERLPGLKLVAHAAGTIKGIVDPALPAGGVRVTTAARANAEPVAEFSLSWILRWNKGLDAYEAAYRAERQDYDMRGRGRQEIGNFRASVGVISASYVGRALIRMLQPFEIDCLLYDPFVSADDVATIGARKVGLDTLLAQSDIVSLNAPLLPATEGMIGAAQFAAMKPGALFLNTARGRIVDQDAMIAALRTRRISAVLDVTDPEPLPSDSPLWDLPNAHITPHVAGSLGREITRMTGWCLAEIERFVGGEDLLSEIDPSGWELAA